MDRRESCACKGQGHHRGRPLGTTTGAWMYNNNLWYLEFGFCGFGLGNPTHHHFLLAELEQHEPRVCQRGVGADRPGHVDRLFLKGD
jgi:hypothetical protein